MLHKITHISVFGKMDKVRTWRMAFSQPVDNFFPVPSAVLLCFLLLLSSQVCTLELDAVA